MKTHDLYLRAQEPTNNKAANLTIKKLTKGNATMEAKFAELKQADLEDDNDDSRARP
jgi:hypothetical protein